MIFKYKTRKVLQPFCDKCDTYKEELKSIIAQAKAEGKREVKEELLLDMPDTPHDNDARTYFKDIVNLIKDI